MGLEGGSYRPVTPEMQQAPGRPSRGLGVSRVLFGQPADCRITINKVSENFSCFSPPTHPFFAAMADCVTRVRGERTVFNSSTGFNDMHFFSHVLKLPTLGYGPGGEHFHAVNERASVRELVAAAKIYAELLTTFTG